MADILLYSLDRHYWPVDGDLIISTEKNTWQQDKNVKIVEFGQPHTTDQFKEGTRVHFENKEYNNVHLDENSLPIISKIRLITEAIFKDIFINGYMKQYRIEHKTRSMKKCRKSTDSGKTFVPTLEEFLKQELNI